MEPLFIVVIFFAILAACILFAAVSKNKKVRILMAMVAFVWSCFMFQMVSWVERLNYNIWYSDAAAKFLDASIEGIEEGRTSQVLDEMKEMREELHPTYESRGNFKESAERAAKRLSDK